MREQRSTMPEGPEDARSLCILLLSCIKDVKLTQRVLLFVWCRIFNKTIPIQVDITPKTNTLYVLVCCTFNKAFKPLSLLILAFLVILPFSRPLLWLTTLTMMLTTPNKEERKKLEGAKKKGGEWSLDVTYRAPYICMCKIIENISAVIIFFYVVKNISYSFDVQIRSQYLQYI